jgi:hypothetical protein
MVRGGAVPEPAQVDGAPDSLATGQLGEAPGGPPLALDEVAPGATPHRVNQVIGDVDVAPGARERVGVEDVADVQLGAAPRQILGASAVPNEAADLRALVEQPLGEPASDEPRCSCHQRAHLRPVRTIPSVGSHVPGIA